MVTASGARGDKQTGARILGAVPLQQTLEAVGRGRPHIMTDSERDIVWREVAGLKSAVRELEIKVDSKIESMAPRDWVHTVLQPVQESLVRMETSVSQLTQDAKELFDAHKEMLRERGERERAEWMEKTPLGIVKRYAPAVGFLLALVALFRVIGTAIELWLKARG